MRVLLIEAGADRWTRASALASLDLEVIVAEGVERALRTTLAVPDMVLLTHRGNREALAHDVCELRATPALSSVPLAVLGHGLGAAITAMSAGADDYWQLPIDQRTFRYVVAALARSAQRVAGAQRLPPRDPECTPVNPQRKAPRTPWAGLARFRLRRGEPWVTGLVSNLAPGGAFLRTTMPPAEDSVIDVIFEVPYEEKRVVAAARVAWTRGLKRGPPPWGMGVQFNDLPAAAREALTNVVTRRQPDGSVSVGL